MEYLVFNTEVKRISGVLAGAMIIWLFGQTLMISPLVVAVRDMVRDNKIEHNMIVEKLENIGIQVSSNKVEIEKTKPLLFRVVSDCEEHHKDIKDCRADFWKERFNGKQ